MQESLTLDEVDLALVHALQIAPRAPWTLVGQVMGINPVTAARRWERLTEQQVAWVSCYPGQGMATRCVVAFVEADCEPAERHRLVATLTQDPRVATVEVIASGRDLFLTMFIADLGALSRFLLDELSLLPGVRGTRIQLGTGVYAHGADWRLDALSADQKKRISRTAPPQPAGHDIPVAAVRPLLLALGQDGRRSATQLAESVGASPSTIRRRLSRIEREQLLSFRCEVANVVSRWPVIATFWASVPPDDLAKTAHAVAGLPGVRLCTGVTGASNLLITMWLRSLADSQRIEALLAQRFPDLVLNDRAVALRVAKRMGRLLDDVGRSTGVVPIDPWYVPAGSTRME
jgi:DNA-binding Lrp family transcriptional regulator